MDEKLPWEVDEDDTPKRPEDQTVEEWLADYDEEPGYGNH